MTPPCITEVTRQLHAHATASNRLFTLTTFSNKIAGIMAKSLNSKQEVESSYPTANPTHYPLLSQIPDRSARISGIIASPPLQIFRWWTYQRGLHHPICRFQERAMETTNYAKELPHSIQQVQQATGSRNDTQIAWNSQLKTIKQLGART